MKCGRCNHEFSLRDARTRSSVGSTGGSSAPLALGIAALFFTAAGAAMFAVTAHWMYQAFALLIAGISWLATLTAYADANAIVCPECDCKAATRWPWST